MRFLHLMLLLGLCLAPQSSVSAADKSPAITDLKDVDADFAFQGEYLGSALDARNCCKSCGLQVVALGNGEFQAVEYVGGLPGYGVWGETTRLKYAGKLEGDTLTLTGESRQIQISYGQATISAIGDYQRVLGNACRVTRQSATIGACPPCGAVVLFDGSNTDHFKDGKMTEDGLLKEGTETKDAYGDFRLHLEFRLPYMPLARGQGRANSGVYIQSRYEVQVLDSFGLDGEFNEAGALYRERKPDLNMCLPPLSWQTYDIWFRSPRFDADGKKIENARLTAWLNGVPVQNDLSVESPTGAGKRIGEGPNALPTKLQNHSNPIRFRNIWIVPMGGGSSASGNVPSLAGSNADPQLVSLLQTIGLAR